MIKIVICNSFLRLLFLIEKTYSAILKHSVHVTRHRSFIDGARADTYAEGIRISLRFLKNYIRPNFSELLSFPPVYSLYLRGPGGASSWTKRFASFQDFRRLLPPFSHPCPHRHCRHHCRLRRFYLDRLEKCSERCPTWTISQMLVWVNLRRHLSIPSEIFAKIFCMNAKDYRNAIGVNRIQYDVIFPLLWFDADTVCHFFLGMLKIRISLIWNFVWFNFFHAWMLEKNQSTFNS